MILLQIQNMIDVRRFLAKFGYVIYTGTASGDLELIKEEVLELYQAKLIDKEDFVQLMNVLTKEEIKNRTI